jgi:hypothetical protein
LFFQSSTITDNKKRVVSHIPKFGDTHSPHSHPHPTKDAAFRGVGVPRNGEPVWMSRPRCSKARNPQSSLRSREREFRWVPGSREREPEPNTHSPISELRNM